MSTPSDTVIAAMDHLSLAALRADFERRSQRALSLPLAGMLMWSIAGIASLFLPQRTGLIVLIAAVSSIFPLALLIAKIRGEDVLGRENPLTGVMLSGVIMVNLLWLLTFLLFTLEPRLVPMCIGLSLGLHWVLYSWIVRHPVGTWHAVVRALALFATVLFVPAAYALPAAAAVVVACYAGSLAVMARRPIAAGHVPA